MALGQCDAWRPGDITLPPCAACRIGARAVGAVASDRAVQTAQVPAALVPTAIVRGVAGPLLAFVIVLVIARIGQWIWRPGRPRARDYGLLIAAATVPSRAAADQATALLREHGIRATIGSAPPVVHVSPNGHAVRQPPRHQVLVFPADLAAARALLES